MMAWEQNKIELVPAHGMIVMLFEDLSHGVMRTIYLNRGHPVKFEANWMGDSVGKWDGNILAIDTIGFNDKTWLNGQGLPHSDQLHVTERYQRPDLGHLSVDITLDDTKAFTRPHTFNRTYALLADWEIHEYVCNEFNIDADHLVGNQK